MCLRTVAAVCAATVVFYGLVLALFSAQGLPDAMRHRHAMPYLADKPLGEDAFYLLSAADSISRGDGLTLHGAAITGVQPLMVFVYAGLDSIVRASGGGRWAFARAALALNVALFLAFAVCVARLAGVIAGSPHAAGSGDVRLTAFIAAASSYSIFRVFTYGLETGAYLVLIALCVEMTCRRGSRNAAWAVALGLVAACAALARIDFVVVFAVYLVVACSRRAIPLESAIVAALVAMAGVLPWFAWTFGVSGSVIPSSGAAQFGIVSSADAFDRAAATMAALLQHWSPLLYVRAAGALPTALGVVVIAGAIWIAACLVRAIPRRDIDSDTRVMLHAWSSGIGVLIATYAIAFRPTFFYLRYSAPLVVIALPCLAIGFHVLVSTRRWMVPALAAAPVLFLATAAATLHTGRIGDRNALTAGFVASRLDPYAPVGAFQSGVAGFFNDNVVNLDGKVNLAALAAASDRTIDRYIDASGIAYLVDEPEHFAVLPAAWLREQWMQCGVQPPEGLVCLQRRPSLSTRLLAR